MHWLKDIIKIRFEVYSEFGDNQKFEYYFMKVLITTNKNLGVSHIMLVSFIKYFIQKLLEK